MTLDTRVVITPMRLCSQIDGAASRLWVNSRGSPGAPARVLVFLVFSVRACMMTRCFFPAFISGISATFCPAYAVKHGQNSGVQSYIRTDVYSDGGLGCAAGYLAPRENPI